MNFANYLSVKRPPKDFYRRFFKSSSCHSAEAHHLNFDYQLKFTRRDTSRLLVQLQETETRFDHFYDEHTKELRNVLELRRFEQDFRELQV
jgi:hypothetical protein